MRIHFCVLSHPCAQVSTLPLQTDVCTHKQTHVRKTGFFSLPSFLLRQQVAGELSRVEVPHQDVTAADRFPVDTQRQCQREPLLTSEPHFIAKHGRSASTACYSNVANRMTFTANTGAAYCNTSSLQTTTKAGLPRSSYFEKCLVTNYSCTFQSIFIST